MADPIFSPDGKWMWTGSEWIPAPPIEAPKEKIDTSFIDNLLNINRLFGFNHFENRHQGKVSNVYKYLVYTGQIEF